METFIWKQKNLKYWNTDHFQLCFVETFKNIGSILLKTVEKWKKVGMKIS